MEITQQVKVNCGVSNCAHNTEEGFCSAKQIRVGPSYAISSMDTICTSFVNKK